MHKWSISINTFDKRAWETKVKLCFPRLCWRQCLSEIVRQLSEDHIAIETLATGGDLTHWCSGAELSSTWTTGNKWNSDAVENFHSRPIRDLQIKTLILFVPTFEKCSDRKSFQWGASRVNEHGNLTLMRQFPNIPLWYTIRKMGSHGHRVCSNLCTWQRTSGIWLTRHSFLGALLRNGFVNVGSQRNRIFSADLELGLYTTCLHSLWTLQGDYTA